jgi:hypothetical protein
MLREILGGRTSCRVIPRAVQLVASRGHDELANEHIKPHYIGAKLDDSGFDH